MVPALAWVMTLLGAASIVVGQDLAFTDTTAGVGRGFGSNWNRYTWSMYDYKGDLYAGTWNVQFDFPALVDAIRTGQIDLSDPDFNVLEGIGFLASRGGEIWRMQNHNPNKWQRVLKLDDANSGFREMMQFNGRLYAGTQNEETGTQLYSSADGKRWTRVTGGPLSNPNNNSNRTMAVIGNRLYVGTENNTTGGELWSLNKQGKWRREATFPNDSAVSEILERNGKIYVGTWDFTDNYSLYRFNSQNNVTNVTPTNPALAGLSNLGVMALHNYQGQTYLGTVNYFQGFSLLRTTDPDDPASWQVITTDGLNSQLPDITNADNAYTWSIAEWNGQLYIGTFNHGLAGGQFSPLPVPLDGRSQLLRSSDGVNWELVNDDGFGSPFTYGIRTLVVGSNNKLYIGTASNFVVPDLQSELYLDPRRGIGWQDVEDALIDAGFGDQVEALQQLLAQYVPTGGRPWIGTQVFVATPNGPVTLADAPVMGPLQMSATWTGDAVPEPGAVLLAAGCVTWLMTRRSARMR